MLSACHVAWGVPLCLAGFAESFGWLLGLRCYSVLLLKPAVLEKYLLTKDNRDSCKGGKRTTCLGAVELQSISLQLMLQHIA